MPPAPESTSAISEFVKRQKPEARSAFLALRALVVSLGPDVVEQVLPTMVVYLRRDRQFAKVESLRGTRLTVAFPPVIPLEDPMGRLLRRGEERYFKLDKAEDLDGHGQEFVRNAYAAVR